MNKTKPDKIKYAKQLNILVVIIILAIILMATALTYIEFSNTELVSRLEMTQQKLVIFNKMRGIVRQRVILLQSAVINEDPFARDDLLIRHSQFANMFISLTDDLRTIDKQYSYEEKQQHQINLLLDRLWQVSQQSYQIQSRIKQLLVDEKNAEARDLISQDDIISSLQLHSEEVDKLITFYSESLKDLTLNTNSTTLQSFQFLFLIVMVILIFILVLGKRLLNIIGTSENNLLHEIKKRTQVQEELQLYQHTLEDIIKERTSELSSSEAKTQMILDNAPVAIISVDMQGKTIAFNTHAELIFGYHKDEMLGQEMMRLLPEELRPQYVNRLQHYKETGECEQLNQRLEIKGLKKSGKIFPIELRIQFTKLDNEAFFTMMISDVSEQQAMHTQLLQAQKLESVGQLAAGVAHEINTPMQYITDNTRFLNESFIDLCKVQTVCNQLSQSLADNKSDVASILEELEALKEDVDIDFIMEEIPPTFKQTLEGLDSVSSIISAMKSFSHPGKKEKSICSLNKIISDTIIISRNEWKYIANLVNELDDSLADIKLHPNLIGQVLLNLIVNAAHAIDQNFKKKNITDQKGIIKVTSSLFENYQKIDISDNGGGISSEIEDKIFDPFFTTKDVGKGTGQGLSMAYMMIKDKHKGKLEFTNNEIGGTTFSIYLPA